jgi:hypothetical protein
VENQDQNEKPGPQRADASTAAEGRTAPRADHVATDSPVMSLPRKYDEYFQSAFGDRSPLSPATVDRCCRSAVEIPVEDGAIGPAFAELTRRLSTDDPRFEATREEVAMIAAWPPEQLRALRAAFIEIFFPPQSCRVPKKAKFKGRKESHKSITVTIGDRVEVTFTGP